MPNRKWIIAAISGNGEFQCAINACGIYESVDFGRNWILSCVLLSLDGVDISDLSNVSGGRRAARPRLLRRARGAGGALLSQVL